MGLYPQSFIDDLRAQADIVQVVQDHVPLRQSGAGFKGLCPFHSEKSPSFHVNREKGVFYCFGCGVGGDVFKFVELQSKLGFQEAVVTLAQRFGVALPEIGEKDEVGDREREALLKIHELVLGYFREQLDSPAGARARQQLADRNILPATIDKLQIGYAPPMREAVKKLLLAQGFEVPLLLRSGLVVERENGQLVDRFRQRIMIPICRDTGSVVAFGGRAMDSDQQPKYLNSPETAIYSKGRLLYGLHLSKTEIRRLGYVVMVEGYFDFGQALQAGITPLVASSGTALTLAQVQLLRKFTGRIVLSFDPDAAGQGAASRSCELLVDHGFQVNVALLPAGEDPDTYVQRHGGNAYLERLKASQPYLEYLLDRSAGQHDLGTDEGRRDFLSRMLVVASRIPDAAARDQFADRLAHKARILEEVVRAEIRKAAVSKRTTLSARELPGFGTVKPAERAMIWSIWHQPGLALEALGSLEEVDLEGLRTGPILEIARSLKDCPPGVMPETLQERLNRWEVDLVESIKSEPGPQAPPAECVKAIKRLRFERERAAVQSEIDRLQELGAAKHDIQIDRLWEQKRDLMQRIESLTI